MASVPVPGNVSLLVVDGNSLGHRAWHAISGSADEVGEFVAAGVLGLITSVWHHGPYDALLVAFDHERNHRKDLHPTYKAGRQTDPDLQLRLRQLANRLAQFGVATVDEPGLEADDLIAAAAHGATAMGWHTDVLSGDRDLTALVSDHVRLLRPRGTMSDLIVTSPGVVRAEYGVEASQYHDFAALRGDPSDGLPGVNGVGPKTATTLLVNHGTLDELYANLCYLPTKVERALRDGREVAFHNRAIMEPISPTEPIEASLVAAASFNLDAIVVILEDLGSDDPGLARVARRLARVGELATLPRADHDGVPLPDEPIPDGDAHDIGQPRHRDVDAPGFQKRQFDDHRDARPHHDLKSVVRESGVPDDDIGDIGDESSVDVTSLFDSPAPSAIEPPDDLTQPSLF